MQKDSILPSALIRHNYENEEGLARVYDNTSPVMKHWVRDLLGTLERAGVQHWSGSAPGRALHGMGTGHLQGPETCKEPSQVGSTLSPQSHSGLL